MAYLFGLGAYFVFVAAAYLLIRGASQLSDRPDRVSSISCPNTGAGPNQNSEESAKPAAVGS